MRALGAVLSGIGITIILVCVGVSAIYTMVLIANHFTLTSIFVGFFILGLVLTGVGVYLTTDRSK